MLVWQTENYAFDYQPEPAKTIQHKTPCTRRTVLKLWYFPHTARVHTVLHVYMLNTRQHIPKSCLNACQQYHRCSNAILTSSQMSRLCTLALLRPPYLFVFFFPEGAPPALGEQWKSCWWCSAESVSEGGGSGARPGISNSHTESQAEDQPRPVQQQSRGEGKHPLETRCPSTQILFHWTFSGCIHASVHEACISNMSTFHRQKNSLFLSFLQCIFQIIQLAFKWFI